MKECNDGKIFPLPCKLLMWQFQQSLDLGWSSLDGSVVREISNVEKKERKQNWSSKEVWWGWEVERGGRRHQLSSLPRSHVAALTYVQTRPRSAAPFTPRILFCGPPGSGKSLQAALLAQKYGVVNSKFSVTMHFALSPPFSLSFLTIYLFLSVFLACS